MKNNRLPLFVLAFIAAVLLLVGMLAAVPSPTAHAAPNAGPVFLTHSTDPNIITSGFGCASTTEVRENRLIRVYDLSAFGMVGPVTITSVSAGIADFLGGSIPVEIRLYTWPSGALSFSNFVLQSTTATTIQASHNNTVVNFPVSPTLFRATDVVVVEIYVADQTGLGNRFRLGVNAAGQSGPSYIVAPVCGVSSITDMATLGFTQGYLLHLHGEEGSPLVWDGGGADNNWSTAANWSDDTVPGMYDSAHFTSSSVKDSVVDGAFGGSVGVLFIDSTYTGEISFGRSLDVGGAYSQNGGTLVVNPAHTFTVDGDFVHTGGVLEETRTVGSNSTINFLRIQTSNGVDVYRGVDLDTNGSGNDLESTTVSIKAVDRTTTYCTSTGALSPVYAGRCYDISPTNNLAANVTLWALSSELPGGITNPSVYHYQANLWTELTNITTGTTGSYVWSRGDTTGFSPFLMGQAGVGNEPTAVFLSSTTTSPNPASTIPLLATLLTLLSGALLWLRRRIN